MVLYRMGALIKTFSGLQFLEKLTDFRDLLLTHFTVTFHFCTPLKLQKTRAFLMFSGGTKMEYSIKWFNKSLKTVSFFLQKLHTSSSFYSRIPPVWKWNIDPEWFNSCPEITGGRLFSWSFLTRKRCLYNPWCIIS